MPESSRGYFLEFFCAIFVTISQDQKHSPNPGKESIQENRPTEEKNRAFNPVRTKAGNLIIEANGEKDQPLTQYERRPVGHKKTAH